MFFKQVHAHVKELVTVSMPIRYIMPFQVVLGNMDLHYKHECLFISLVFFLSQVENKLAHVLSF